jgi:hypothetical protein
MREYRVDLLDFYRGTLTARRLWVLVRQLSAKSGLVRALNDGRPKWTTTDHLIADLWSLWAKQDHPVRAEAEARARTSAKLARVVELRATFEKRKHTYGLGGVK